MYTYNFIDLTPPSVIVLINFSPYKRCLEEIALSH